MPDEIVRVVRVLEYVGKRSVIEHTFEHNAVKGIQVTKDLTIREAFLGPFPETISQEVK